MPAACRLLIQIPVFFSLYKVLFITIEMRHAPFFGWIYDLSAPDPTNIFTLFGLIPFDPTVLPMIGSFLHLGIWPLIMGVTMWVQMKLNPAPPDPTQQMIFNYMPIIFTFMLGSFPVGLVIYWAWNNTLSVMQQSAIMHRHGAKIELWDNLKRTFTEAEAAGVSSRRSRGITAHRIEYGRVSIDPGRPGSAEALKWRSRHERQRALAPCRNSSPAACP